MASPKPPVPLRPLPRLIFASRWLQLPLYLGLIAAQAVYVFHFWVELVHLLEAAWGSQTALQALVDSAGYQTTVPLTALNETLIMLVVLALIDVVMISNLLIMVIVGGYETFVSRMDLEGHRDQPQVKRQLQPPAGKNQAWQGAQGRRRFGCGHGRLQTVALDGQMATPPAPRGRRQKSRRAARCRPACRVRARGTRGALSLIHI